MFALKYKSNPFGVMSENERLNWADALLVKIHVITGWVIPGGILTDVVVDQFQKKLFESYPTINPDEVEYAFRTQGTTIKDWGKEMNLSLIDQVMIPYLEKRFEVSKIEDQEKTKLMSSEIKEPTPEEMIADWESNAELVKNKNYNPELLPEYLYNWMDSQGNISITGEEKMKYVERATLSRHSKIAMDYEKNPYSLETKKTLADFNSMRESKLWTKEEKDKITALAKKMIIYEMMKQDFSPINKNNDDKQI